MDINQVKEQCIEKWGPADEKTEKFYENFDKWCSFSTEEETEICLELLKNFDYYNKQNVNEELKIMHDYLTKIFKTDLEYTIFTIIKNKKGRANSSLEYFYEYIHINQINRYSRIEDINMIDENLYKNIKNIVIIDDCIGSGQTVKDFLNQYRERLLGKTIYLILIHLVIESALELDEFAKENGYELNILCKNKKNRAFGNKEQEEIKKKFITLSRNREIPCKYILGRDNVEGLMAFYNNTPNNTLGLFWCETEKNIPLFPRAENSRPGWMLSQIKKERQKRKIQNYENKRSS